MKKPSRICHSVVYHPSSDVSLFSLVTRIAVVLLAAASIAFAYPARADEPFYKGKTLTLLINFAPGGPTDIEGRLLAKHIAKHIDGHPTVIVENKDGAAGMVGAAYLGEVGPKDGSIFGYFTGTSWNYVIEPEKFRCRFPRLRVHRLSARQHRLLHPHRHSAGHEKAGRPDEGAGPDHGRARRRFLEGPAGAADRSTCSA